MARIFFEVLLLVLFGLSAFFLGRASRVYDTSYRTHPIVVLEPDTSEYKTLYKQYETTTVKMESESLTGKSSGRFGASVNGTRYYPTGCGGLGRIKPENIIWFTSEQEAIDAGYSRAANC